MRRSKLSTILLSGFIAGTLDILCAIFILAGGNAAGTFRFIARGAFGEAAYTGGMEMIFLGAVFHYVIAFSFAIAYFFAYPHLPFLKKYKILSGLLYGIFVWGFMRFVVLPMTHNAPGPIDWISALTNIVILMLAIGLPISFITSRYYEERS